jgi:hypothetical protein
MYMCLLHSGAAQSLCKGLSGSMHSSLMFTHMQQHTSSGWLGAQLAISRTDTLLTIAGHPNNSKSIHLQGRCTYTQQGRVGCMYTTHACSHFR